MIDHRVAVFLIKVRKYFRVGLSDELVISLFELGPHLAIIVKLAVHHHHDRTIAAKHRLIASLQVDDRKPTHPQRGLVVDPQPFRIRPAMHDPLTHRVQHRFAVRRRIVFI